MRSLSFDCPSHHRRTLAALMLALAVAVAPSASAQRADSAAARPEADAGASSSQAPLMFRSGVNLVSVAAVVRDRRGKVIPSLGRDDFEVIDGGAIRPVVDVRADSSAPASVALLVDGSGSMRFGGARALSQRISDVLLTSLNPERDAAALLSFDTRLLTLCEFTRDFERIRGGLLNVEAFGSSAIYDAVAGSAAMVAERERNRRAVIVLTDGLDNASAYPPGKVAWIASTIDVPIYVFDVGERPGRGEKDGATPHNILSDLARATGGESFVANTPALVEQAAQRVSEELRHQYLIAFEGIVDRGVRRVEVRTRKPNLRVQSRAWYHVE